MTERPDLGVKRRCLSCEAPFFDMNRDPITCVKCGAVFTVVELPRRHPPGRPKRFGPLGAPMAQPAQADVADAAPAQTDEDNLLDADPDEEAVAEEEADTEEDADADEPATADRNA